jgi:hypothetical protein
MTRFIDPARLTMLVALGAVFGLSGCETDFGQPCELPQTKEFRQACDPVADQSEEDDENAVQTQSKASCAVRNFAGCATRVCLVYRGSEPFCSEACVTSEDCEGSAICRPIIGDQSISGNICEQTECYCVRSGDLNDE